MDIHKEMWAVGRQRKIMFSKEWSLWILKSNRKLTANTLDNETHVLGCPTITN